MNITDPFSELLFEHVTNDFTQHLLFPTTRDIDRIGNNINNCFNISFIFDMHTRYIIFHMSKDFLFTHSKYFQKLLHEEIDDNVIKFINADYCYVVAFQCLLRYFQCEDINYIPETQNQIFYDYFTDIINTFQFDDDILLKLSRDITKRVHITTIKDNPAITNMIVNKIEKKRAKNVYKIISYDFYNKCIVSSESSLIQ